MHPSPGEIEPYVQRGLVSKRTRRSGSTTLALYDYTDVCQRKGLWDRVTRCCRGLILEVETGRVVALPFEKFFNVNEVPETRWEVLPWNSPFAVLEKYDGALGIIYFHNEIWDIATRRSFHSPITSYARKKLLPKLNLNKLEKGYTYLVEIVSPVSRGLVPYPWEGLVLIGRRHNETGELLWPARLPTLAEEIGAIPPRVFTLSPSEDFAVFFKKLQEDPQLREGVVVTFQNGLMVKIKTQQYILLLRASMRFPEEKIVEAVASGQEERLLEEVPEEFYLVVKMKMERYAQLREELLQRVQNYFAPLQSIEDRKKFALEVQRNVPEAYWGFMFALRDGKDISGLTAKTLLEEGQNS